MLGVALDSSAFDKHAEEDFISNLPEDLHIRLCSYLNYEDAFNFALSNRRLYALRLHRDVKIVKTESLQLIISQEHHRMVSQYFVISGDDMGKLPRSEKPDIMLDRVKQLLKRFSLKKLKFNAIVIDAPFLDLCLEVFQSTNIDEVEFVQSVFHQESEPEYAHKFTDWLASMTPKTIYFGQSLIERSGLIDEHFIERIVAASNRGKKSLKIITSNRSNGITFYMSRMCDVSENLREWSRSVKSMQRAILKGITRSPYTCSCELERPWYDNDEIVDFGPDFQIAKPIRLSEWNTISEKSSGGSASFVVMQELIICHSIPQEQ